MDQLNDRWSEKITLGEAYMAMVEFAWTYYRVGGEAEKEIEFFASHIGVFFPAQDDGTPALCMDPALEQEWFQAVDKVRDTK